jgi:hypothetical protein
MLFEPFLPISQMRKAHLIKVLLPPFFSILCGHMCLRRKLLISHENQVQVHRTFFLQLPFILHIESSHCKWQKMLTFVLILNLHTHTHHWVKTLFTIWESDLTY